MSFTHLTDVEKIRAMKAIVLFLLIAGYQCGFGQSVYARMVRVPGDAELLNKSDLVVIGKPIRVKALDESNLLGWDHVLGWDRPGSIQIKFRGIETTFKVSSVLKGTLTNDQIILHHYSDEWGSPPNGPTLVSFTPNGTNEYLLYLIKDGSHRYAPVAGQLDANLSIKPATSATARTIYDWPVFYNAEKGPEHLLISREALTISTYTNEFPSWNYDLRNPPFRSRINTAKIKELDKIEGLRVMEVQLSLTDSYYTDMLMILEEVKQEKFLPVYVQIYNQAIRTPYESVWIGDEQILIIKTGMRYIGNGPADNRDHYKITISPNHDPVIVGSNY
jgi:hypothetical protein